MAVPKQKTSTQRKGKRRAGQEKLSSPKLVLCKNCGEKKRPHTVCPECKHYRGIDYS